MYWHLASLESYNYEEVDCPASQEQRPRTMLDLYLLIFLIWLSNSSLSLCLGLLSSDNHLIIQLSFSIS